MDDQRLIRTDNPLANGGLTPFTIWFQTGFPLSDLMLRMEWLAWGEQPAFYHVVNIALHGFSAVLVWRVLLELKIPGAWLAAALFVIHPVCVNSVARIAELKNTLSLPLFLLSFWFYLRYENFALYPRDDRRDNGRAVGTICYLLSFIAFIFALFAKTSTVMLPVILLACAVWRRGKLLRFDLVHTAPYFVLALPFGMMSIWFQKYQALAQANQTLQPESILERFLIASRVFWFYLGKALLPLNLNLIYPKWKTEAHSAAAFFPLVLALVCLAVCWRFRKNWGKHFLFGLICFAILLFPALGFFDAQFLTRWQVSDHLQYLALIAPIALFSAVIASVLKSAAYRYGTIAFLLVLSALTFRRAEVFSSQESLMRDTIAKNPLAGYAHNDLGVVFVKRGNLSEARSEFAAAIKADPNDVTAKLNLGQVLLLQGNAQEAKPLFQLVLNAKPFDVGIHLQLASACSTLEQFREACFHLEFADRVKPTADTKLQLAGLHYQTGRFREAASQLRNVLKFRPDSPETLNNLAWLVATCADDHVRDGVEAVRCADRACLLTDYRQSAYLSTLAAAYAEAGRFPQAIQTAEAAMSLQLAAGETEPANLNRQFLTLYRAGKPFHAAPPPGVAVR